MAKSKASIIRHANEFLSMASDDIRGKLMDVMEEADLNPSEIAEALDVDEEEIEDILAGNNITTLETFAKILIATNHCVMVHPVPEDADIDDDDEDEEDDDEDEDIEDDEPICRHHHHHAHPCHHAPKAGELPPVPPFSAMSRDELVDIIQGKLWDSEIDIENATRKELVDFLSKKDARLREMLTRKAPKKEETDKGVAEFRKLLEKKVKENPRLKKALKAMLEE